MCGIGGIFVTRPSQDIALRAQRMQDALRHRGPDDCGTFVNRKQTVAMVHTRLSILDLSPAGHQPMSTADGKYTIVFNGEIYNFQQLRKHLAGSGCEFSSVSDTEVLLQLFVREGPAMLSKLEGMFAFAIWDAIEEQCFIARDPLGVKPLYLWQVGESIAFASEIRGLLPARLEKPSLSPMALAGYLLFGSVQEPETLLENIHAIAPGHYYVWRKGQLSSQEYWRLSYQAEPVDEPDAIELTRSALQDSIQRHFVSDVPVGIFLSGGIDSTALVALARRLGIAEIRTFCISFDESEFDEGEIARKTAQSFGTQHHDWRMTACEGQGLLEEFMGCLDQPSNDGFNTFCVSRFARAQGMKVVLSGLGGDELFGGYQSFQRIPQFMQWHRRARSFGKLAKKVIGSVARMTSNCKAQRVAAYLETDGSVGAAYWTMRAFFTPTEARTLVEHYTGSSLQSLANVFKSCSEMRQPTLQDEIGCLETTRYMRNQLLRDSDVMSMAHGLELRVPLVDRKLLDQVNRIPAAIRYESGKALFLKAVPEIPDFVANRPKRGFRFPFDRWIATQWTDTFSELDRRSPVTLKTWYRRWVLFSLARKIADWGI